MKREDLFFDSRDNSTKIHAVRWLPDTKEPVAVLQIIHGMAEHVDRYEDFAKYLTERGFIVTADDHLGHGKSLNDGLCGYFCKQDPATVVVRDVHRLKKMTQEQFPGIPYFVMGHSMGSFIVRNYMFRYGKGVSGAIVMGTGMQPKALVTGLKIMAGAACLFGKSKKQCKFIDKMSFGTYLSKIPNPRTPFDWLTKEEAIVDKYIADPMCGFIFTGNGFKTLGELLSRLQNKNNLEKMPKDMKVLITSGADDPVGEYGAGPKKVYDSYLALGMTNVDFKLYETDRHEILNETDHLTVYEDIYNWLVKSMI